MIVKSYIQQLSNKYNSYLKQLVQDKPFEIIVLRGGKTKPDNFATLQTAITEFLLYDKATHAKGWTIEWKNIGSKNNLLIGSQQWPQTITVDTEADYLYLIDKEKEVIEFKSILANLLHWKPTLVDWLVLHTNWVLDYSKYWHDIKIVVDYLLVNDVSQYYKRNIPLPVHTKFIEQQQVVIISLMQFLAPDKFNKPFANIDELIGVKQKPYIFPARWLCDIASSQYAHSMEVVGYTAEALKSVHWHIDEIWLVENETALYMLPQRKNAIAICSMGKAVHLLKEIILFKNAQLYYWGDIDEEGLKMLADVQFYYPHTTAVLMGQPELDTHKDEVVTQATYKLTLDETTEPSVLNFYNECKKNSIRLEQEKLQMDYIQAAIVKL